MKNIFKILTALSMIALVSCEDKISDLSLDKDDVIRANDAQVLTSAQGYIAITQDVSLNQGSFLWAQYYTWGIGVSIGNQERYVSQPGDFNAYWQRAYANALTDLKYLTNSTNPAYRGVSKILTAYVFQGLVDHFGDVPYSEALKGEEEAILTPKYDDAATIYADLIVKLDEALVDLQTAEDEGQLEPMEADDVIYGGDLEKWMRFANSLKLRILMRTSEVDPKGAEIIELINSGIFIENESDIAQLEWSGEVGNMNPMFATQNNGVGDFYFASTATVDVLKSLNDPRLEVFYDPAETGPEAGSVRAICQGCVDRDVPFTDPASDYASSSDFANSETSPTVLMSPWEVWFLRAEADARYSTVDDEAVAFANAIKANFEYLGVSGADDYIADREYDPSAALDSKLNLIAIQKWISFNGSQEDEGWIEARRLDRPSSRVFTNGLWQTPPLSVLPAGTFPAAWLYPASEVSFNAANVPAQRAITDKLFWDN